MCFELSLSNVYLQYVVNRCGKYYCYLSSRIRSKFIHANFPLSYFVRQIIDSLLTPPTYFHGSAFVLYILLCRPSFFSIVLDSKPFGSNKGYHSCSPLPSFPHRAGHYRRSEGDFRTPKIRLLFTEPVAPIHAGSLRR
jgi:hypothetical protein